METDLVVRLLKDKTASWSQWIVGLKNLISRLLLWLLCFTKCSWIVPRNIVLNNNKKRRLLYSQVAIVFPKSQMALTQLINMSCLPVSFFHPVLPLLSLRTFSAQLSSAQYLPAHYGSFTPWVLWEYFAVAVWVKLCTCAFSFCAHSSDTEDQRLHHSRLWIKVDLGHWVAVLGYTLFRSPPQFPDALCLMKRSN